MCSIVVDTLSCDQSLPVQPISIRKAQSRKKAHKPSRTSHISPQMCLPCLVIVQSCYCDYRINKTFLRPRCLICILDSGHFISTYYARKGFWAFYRNYPQINEVGKSDHVVSDRYLFVCLFVCLFVQLPL